MGEILIVTMLIGVVDLFEFAIVWLIGDDYFIGDMIVFPAVTMYLIIKRVPPGQFLKTLTGNAVELIPGLGAMLPLKSLSFLLTAIGSNRQLSSPLAAAQNLVGRVSRRESEATQEPSAAEV